MPRRYRPTEVIRVLESEGWVVVRQRGSHVMMRREGSSNFLTISMSRREVAQGTFRSTLRKAGMSPGEFDNKANEVL